MTPVWKTLSPSRTTSRSSYHLEMVLLHRRDLQAYGVGANIDCGKRRHTSGFSHKDAGERQPLGRACCTSATIQRSQPATRASKACARTCRGTFCRAQAQPSAYPVLATIRHDFSHLPEPAALARRSTGAGRSRDGLRLLSGLWLILFFASLFSPPVLDDADGTHANAARQMLLSGDWVTLRVSNVRYLEKAPLPYWIAPQPASVSSAAIPSRLIFHRRSPVLLLMLLGFRWAREAFGDRAALYTGLGVLTSTRRVPLHPRLDIPEVMLSLLLAAALYCFLRSVEPAAATLPGAPHISPLRCGLRRASTPTPCGPRSPSPCSPKAWSLSSSSSQPPCSFSRSPASCATGAGSGPSPAPSSSSQSPHRGTS